MKFAHHKWGLIFDSVTLAIPSPPSCLSSRPLKPPLLLSFPTFPETHSPPLYTNLSLTRTRKAAFVSVMKQRQYWNTGNMMKCSIETQVKKYSLGGVWIFSVLQWNGLLENQESSYIYMWHSSLHTPHFMIHIKLLFIVLCHICYY